MKLTNEEIVKVFINHIFCSAIYKKSNAIFEITGLTWMFNQYHLLTNPSCNMGYSVAECQLLLTPLSSISDEDAVELAKIIHKLIHPLKVLRNNNRIVVVSTGNDELAINKWLVIQDGDIWVEVDEIVEKLNYEDAISVFQYLISKGYDVPLFFGIDHPCNGKTAIELGIAIDKTKI